MATKYIFFYMEIALRKKKDLYVYAFENISHIPTKKLIEIFDIDVSTDPQILDGYFLKRRKYKKYKKYIRANIGCSINMDVFEYSLRQYAEDDFNSVRKLYKESLME